MLQIKPSVNNKYVEFVKLTELKDVRPEGYVLRMPFYLRAKANAFLLLSTKEKPTEKDDAYEIGTLKCLLYLYHFSSFNFTI